MSLEINIRHLEDDSQHYEGAIEVQELDMETRDDLIQMKAPLEYSLEAELHDRNLFVQGKIAQLVDCECVRCLKAFQFPIEISDWSCLLPLAGEEAVPLSGDCVDLTHYLREDILLNLPQHPLCEQTCGGLGAARGGNSKVGGVNPAGEDPSAWAALDKLKLE